MSSSTHLDPVAAGPPGAKAQPSWLLELGAAAREVESRASFQEGRGLRVRAWSSRRAGARARRELLRQALLASAVELEAAQLEAIQLEAVQLEPVQLEPVEPEPEPEPDEDAEERAPLSTALLARIGAYTVPVSSR